jgi:hypothetical protein
MTPWPRASVAGRMVANIIKMYAERTGIDSAAFSGHSLRSGVLSSAAEPVASIWKLSEVSRHKSLNTLRGYGSISSRNTPGRRSCEPRWRDAYTTSIRIDAPYEGLIHFRCRL